jgi:hypothetical protein
LSDYLGEHTIEECVRAARAARAPKPSGGRKRKSTMPIKDVPQLADGRFVLTIEITNGQARFVVSIR